jgi:DegV family protein with EDD domain
MKQKVAILTDSSSCIYTMSHNYDNIFMVNISSSIGEEVFTDFEKNGDGVFYDALSKTKLVPKTSQPSAGETLQKYEDIKALGYTHIIYLPISKELSGTYQNGYLAKDMVEGIEIVIVDTLTTVSILGRMVLEAAKMAKENKSLEEILAKTAELKTKWGYYFTVNDLTALVKNGRLSNAKSFVANLLKIRPVIKFKKEDGKIVAIENIRTYKSAVKAVIKKVVDEVDPIKGEVHIAYTNNVEDMEMAKALILEILPNVKIFTYTLSATIVAHLGLAAVGIGYINY